MYLLMDWMRIVEGKGDMRVAKSLGAGDWA